ncbi:MAG: hypothetical protein C5B51_30550 [Terriglobia bacterium]|nr:MAG: hypothetical protein C5B51_30550 [Terriglobia bacterium]
MANSCLRTWWMDSTGLLKGLRSSDWSSGHRWHGSIASSMINAVPRYTSERLLGVASLAGVAIFLGVGIERPVWLDEANSVLIAARGFSGIVEGLRHENNLPGYYLLLSVWMRVFGDSEIALRSLSAIFYLGGCLAAGVLGKRAGGNARAGWYSAFFYACSPLAIRNAQNIRMYALLGMLSGVSALSFLELFWQGDRSWRGKTCFLVVNACGLATHVWFSFVLGAQFLAVVLFARRELRRFVALALAAAAPIVLLWGPFFVEQIRNGATSWMAPLSGGVILTAFTEFYGYVPAALLYGFATLAWTLSPAGQRLRTRNTHSHRVLAFLFAASLAAPLLICAVRPIYWPGRYAIIALPAIAALIGIVLAESAPRALLAGVCLLFLGFGIATQFAQREIAVDTQLPAGQSDRTTAEFLLQHATPGDAIVFTSLTRAAADYYFRRAHAEERFVEISFPQEIAGHLGWADSRMPPERQGALQAEAASAGARLCGIAAAGHKVWLYDGYSPQINAVLKGKLDAALTRRREYPLLGPYHSRIVEYDPPQSISASVAASFGPGSSTAVARAADVPRCRGSK